MIYISFVMYIHMYTVYTYICTVYIYSYKRLEAVFY